MPNSRIKHLLAACFLVSGATSLVLQVAWAQELSYILGNSLYAVSTVVAAFMTGLALGSFGAARWLDGLRRPILAYALLELVIGACGLVSIPVLRATPEVFAGIYQSGLSEQPTAFFAVRFSIVFALMVVPTTLMGMTLPLVAGAYGRARRGYDFETGILYGINTLGAVLGTVLAGFALIPQLGLWATCAAVGAADAVVGGVALGLHRALGPLEAPAPRARSASPGWLSAPGRIGLLYLLSGLVAIVLEVMWFRYLAYVFGPTANAFSVMLALFLAGIAAGSVAGAPLARRTRDAAFDVARLQLLLAGLVLATTLAYNALPELYGSLYFRLSEALGTDASALAQGLAGSLVVLPPTFAMGALFPVTLRCYREAFADETHAEETVGRLYALNTVGGILGSFAAGFVVLPRLGIWNTGVAMAFVSVLLGTAFALLSRRPFASRAGLIAVAVAGCALFALLSPRIDLLAMNKGSFMALGNPFGFKSMMSAGYDTARKLLFYREGIHNSVAVTSAQGNLYLRLSGRPAADTTMPGRAHLILLGQLPALFAERPPRTVAVVGFGVGLSTGASLTHGSVERVDVLELEPGVLEASRYFAYLNGDPLRDPRTRVLLDDGRTTLSYSGETYDVITSDALSPLAAGAANLYTTDYFEIASARLSDHGIFCQWIETYIPSEATLKSIVASVRAVFPHVALFNWGPDVLLLGSRRPIEVPWLELRERFAAPGVAENLALLGVRTPADLLTLYLGGTAEVDAYLAAGGGVRLNTDDRNWLERQMPHDLNRRHRQKLPELLARRFGPDRAEAIERLVPGVPLSEVVRATVLPADPMLAARAPLMAEAFREHFQRAGDTAMVARMRAWRREAATSERAPLTVERYEAMIAAFKRSAEAGDAAAAETALRRIVAYPTQGFYYQGGIALIRMLAERGETDEALSITRALEIQFPGFAGAFAEEARILRQRGDGEAAARAAQRGLGFNPDNADLRRLAGG